MLHEQAIYQHDGECWQVERFDYENHKAFVRKVEPDYWTDAMTYVQVARHRGERDGRASLAEPTWTSGWGEVAVVEKVVGYKKIKFYTHENAGYGDVRLPEMQMHTTAFWLTRARGRRASVVPERARRRDRRRCAASGMALETVATLALMCDPRDLGHDAGRRGRRRRTASGGVPRSGARRPRAGLQPDAVPLRARARRDRARRAHLGAARRAARARAAADRELPLPQRVPGVRRPGRGVAQGGGARAAALCGADGLRASVSWRDRGLAVGVLRASGVALDLAGSA